MSSIDSALNSLAAITLEDVFDRDAAGQNVWTGRVTSLLWGVFACASGLVFARSGALVLELVNQIGSAFYGPVLAVFLLGVAAPGVTGRGAVVGLVAGLAGNLALARLAPGVSWLWWNPAGLLVAAGAALMVDHSPIVVRPLLPRRDGLVLAGAFVVMVIVLALLPRG
jgi:SSS family solute:Na+ symporter